MISTRLFSCTPIIISTHDFIMQFDLFVYRYVNYCLNTFVSYTVHWVTALVLFEPIINNVITIVTITTL